MNYYEHHLGDYLRDTAHLSMIEDGAYRRLIDVYYVKERAIPADLRDACRLVRAATKPERDAVAAVLREFFELGADGWAHKRCDAEIARYQDKQRKARASADARWAHTERNANASPDAMRTHSEGNATRGRARARAPARPQTPDTSHQTPLLHPEDAEGGSAQTPTPPTPPPDFTGINAESLNGKAVVRIGKEFELPVEWGFDAEKLGFAPKTVVYEAERFRQYWAEGNGKDTRRSVKGWRQSWSNWLAKAAERQQR